MHTLQSEAAKNDASIVPYQGPIKKMTTPPGTEDFQKDGSELFQAWVVSAARPFRLG